MAKNSVHLPQEVISEILLKLPVKTLLRCRSVCKLWLSLISDPHFTTSHFQLASSTRLLFIEYRDSQTLSIDFNAWLDDDSAFSLSPDFLHLESRPEIGGSCRGFLFIYCYRDFYLWNPSTRVHKQIPLSPLTIASNSDDSCSSSSSSSSSDSDNDHYSIFNVLYGFGYDMSSDDYMVVLGSYKLNPTVRCSIDLEIFSLRANEWEEIEFDSDLPYRKTARSQSGPRVGSFLNGSIHWLVYNYETRSDVIIAYDLKEMTMSEIGLPDDFDIDFSTDIYDLSVFRGLISVWNVEMSTLKIWVMQEYAVDSSWIKTLDFNFEPAPYFCPVCFTNGGDIVGPVSDGGLAKLDDEGDLLQYHTYGGCCFARSQLAVYTESLLSLPDGIEQA